uniref:Hdf-like antirestriction protein n=1 Tax=Mammaliicoccus phage MSShimriz1 TaxID=3230127 RepID=A0AAU8GS17_9VIRU
MNMKILNALLAKVTDKALMGKTLEEAGYLVMDGVLRTKVVHKGNVYDFVVYTTPDGDALNIKLNKDGTCSSVYIDGDCVEDFEHISTLSELLDDIYKEWEKEVNNLSTQYNYITEFMDVDI